MTVLSANDSSGERNATPPRKKFRLSMNASNYQENLSLSQTNVDRRLTGDSSNKCVFGSSDTRSVSQRNHNWETDHKPLGRKYISDERLETGAMLNGYLAGSEAPNKSSPDDSEGASPIATLCNLGNTCFLNSVLYTLRFAPSFLHNLHHLAADLSQHSNNLKAKSSSLGRNISASGSGVSSTGKSWSSKDLLSLGSSGNGCESKNRIQAATEKLHELYECLRTSEQRSNSDPFQPNVFLHALREVNPIFEGNQQHDAHELLVCLLDNIRETCRLVASQAAAALIAPPQPPPPPVTPRSKTWMVRKSWKKRKPQQRGKDNADNEAAEPVETIVNGNVGFPLTGILENTNDDAAPENEAPPDSSVKNEDGVDDCSGGRKRAAVGYNFVSDDFEGITVLRTTCLECETVTERKESFCDIRVPISTDTESDGGSCGSVFQSAIVTTDNLRDLNKYWCEQCLRYNEARRQVRYERLPRLLVLQLKRFSSTFGSMLCVSKVNDYMPTPLMLPCFCEQCCQLPEDDRPHNYQLYGVIMHLGATIASGHYVAYVRASDLSADYHHCERRRTTSLNGCLGKAGSGSSAKMSGLLKFFHINMPQKSAGSSRNLGSPNGHSTSNFQQPGNNKSGLCRGADCCGIRLQLSSTSSSGTTVGADTAVPETPWLECDDETVRILTRREFEDVLAPKPSKNSALTPYLLFYCKI